MHLNYFGIFSNLTEKSFLNADRSIENKPSPLSHSLKLTVNQKNDLNNESIFFVLVLCQ